MQNKKTIKNALSRRSFQGSVVLGAAGTLGNHRRMDTLFL